MSKHTSNAPPVKPADKLPPFDELSEAGCLACVLSAEPDQAGPLLAKLNTDCFYDLRHRAIFQLLAKLGRDGRALDIVSLTQAARDLGTVESLGGLDYAMALPDRTPSVANFPTFLEAVQDKATRRAAMRDAGELSRLAEDPTVPPAAVAEAARRMGEAHSRTLASAYLQ